MATPAQQIDLNAADSPHVLLGFLEISHPKLSAPIRLVSDVLDYEWSGETYTACPFGYELIDDSDKDPATVLVLPNIDRRIGQAIEESTVRASVVLTILSSADFDLSQDPRVAIGTPAAITRFEDFEAVSAGIDGINIEVSVQSRQYAQEPFPYQRATVDRFPGLGR